MRSISFKPSQAYADTARIQLIAFMHLQSSHVCACIYQNDNQIALLSRLRLRIIPVLVNALTFLKEGSIIDMIMSSFQECMEEGDASQSSPLRNQVKSIPNHIFCYIQPSILTA
jgi:hypothetical protein